MSRNYVTRNRILNMEDSTKEEVHQEENEKKLVLSSILHYFREYCSCTSIHGFRYFGEKRTLIERIWWFIVFVACLTACTTSLYMVYRKWEQSPVTVNFASQGSPLYEIPFPAVTICPESKSASNVFNYTMLMQKKRNNKTLTHLEDQQFEYMSLICNYFPKLFNYTNNNTFSDDFFDVITSIQLPLQLYSCSYLGFPVNCSSFFWPIFTDEGICYTSNILDRSEIFRNNVIHYREFHSSQNYSENWSVEGGYSKDAGIETYPRRALLTGASYGLSLKFVTHKTNLDYACKTSIQGYKAILHSPMRLPRPSQEYFKIPLDHSVVAAVQPHVIKTSEKVKLYNPKKRGCYFPSERYLKYFKIYSSMNCKMECLTNETLLTCGCVNYFMPRENGTKICGNGKMACMKQIEKIMQLYALHNKFTPDGYSKNDCDCLQLCMDVSYGVEISQSPWDWSKWSTAYGNNASDENHLSMLTIFFKSDTFIASERNEFYGPIDFLANFGGLLGLFTGFSVLSLMEILYFLSIRIICNIRLYGYWAGGEL